MRLLEECLVYPYHLSEGKLHGAQENDFYYLLGLCHRAMGSTDKACEAFEQAGPTEPAAAMYYNDAKPDKIFYAGVAYRALGNENKARSYFNRLVDYGKQHLHDSVVMDYFAVSLPDLPQPRHQPPGHQFVHDANGVGISLKLFPNCINPMRPDVRTPQRGGIRPHHYCRISMRQSQFTFHAPSLAGPMRSIRP